MTSGGFIARRARFISVVLLLVAGGTVLLGTTQTWLTAVVAQTDIPVTGSDALPIVQPLALAVLALALVLTLVARVLRYALGVLATAAGVAMTVAIMPVLVERPVTAVATTVTEHTGLAGVEAVADLVTGIALSPWPAVSLVGAVVAVLAGLLTLATAHGWRRGGRRFDTSPAAPSSGPVDPIDSWDELSHGEDPTR
ncbi:Trp biosynthesis-associated membrane protein [Microbacterium halotolerans]|uniref:Trp biosynthesis-associated membrane protein n=1 Tax=Microbacterium halotolerans TaxID=246613 RepID=UPI000E6AB628|nr:Trp biosynthesis-associated membrane protein [Microbacterium halotolerans]